MLKKTFALLYGGSKYRKSIALKGVWIKKTGIFHFGSCTNPALSGVTSLFQATEISVSKGQSISA